MAASPSAAQHAIALAPRDLRDFLVGHFAGGGKDEFLVDVDRILEIDRDYLAVDYDGRTCKIAELTAVLAGIREASPATWRDVELDLVCALGCLGRAWVRLEYTDMVATMDAVVRFMDDTIEQYCTALSLGEQTRREYLGCHWWEKAALVRSLRRRVDDGYRRIAQIDGSNWHRRELLLERRLFAEQREYTQFVTGFLRAKAPDLAPDDSLPMEKYLREASAALIEKEGTPVRLMLALMQAASEDPAIDSDHTTLLCPRGQKLETPWDLGKEDFMCYVVFREGFEPPRAAGVGDYQLIQKAVYAHHSTKKARMAKKYRAMYSADSPASLADDLGDLGVYFNEHAHHKGHVVAGVFSAMRYLMPIKVRRGSQDIVIQGLTDFRLTRATEQLHRRFERKQFPYCHRYGGYVREVLQVAFERGVVFAPMNTSWR